MIVAVLLFGRLGNPQCPGSGGDGGGVGDDVALQIVWDSLFRSGLGSLLSPLVFCIILFPSMSFSFLPYKKNHNYGRIKRNIHLGECRELSLPSAPALESPTLSNRESECWDRGDEQQLATTPSTTPLQVVQNL